MTSLRSLLYLPLLLGALATFVSAEEPPEYLLEWGESGSGRAQFDQPADLFVSKSGAVYVVDAGNSRIHIFFHDGRHDSSYGSFGYGPGEFDDPKGIALNEAGHTYVVDRSNHRVQKFESEGAFLLEWGSYGSGDGQFFSPWDVTLVNGLVYVTDSGNHRVQRFDEQGNFISEWGLVDTLAVPHGIAADSLGHIYVTDVENDRVEKYDTAGVFLDSWGMPGTGTGQFSGPEGIAVDADNNVLVTDLDNGRVQKFSSSGLFLLSWGNPGTQPGEFTLPTGIAVGPLGDIYVLDQDPPRVQRFGYSVEDAMYWVDFGHGMNGSVKYGDLSGSPWYTVTATLDFDNWDVAVDPARRKVYWTSPESQAIRRADLDGSNKEIVIDTGDSSRRPFGLALDVVNSKIYWTEQGVPAVYRAHLDGHSQEALVMSGLIRPNYIALDRTQGEMYWTDPARGTIQRASLDGTSVVDVITGLYNPHGIAIDPGAGKVYWMEVGNHSIERADLDGSNRETLINSGLINAHGISLDLIDGKMYYTDSGTSSFVPEDGDAIKRADLDGSNEETLLTTSLDNPHGIDIVRGGRCPGFKTMQVLSEFNDWDPGMPSMTEIEPCVWEDTVTVPLAGCFNIKFRTNSVEGTPFDYGTCIEEDLSCQTAWSGRVCQTLGDGVGQINFPISGDYVFRLDERDQTYEIIALGLVGVGDKPGVSSSLSLSPAQPNPFRGSTLIRYTLPQKAEVVLKVYDIAGRQVRSIDEGQREAGAHSLRWDGRDDSGRLAAPGLYFYRLNVGGGTQRAVLLR
jgi:DNA-binding beta-propeller fold protein YncE